MPALPLDQPDAYALWAALIQRGLVVALMRYFIIATFLFVLCYMLLDRILRPYRIQGRDYSATQLRREIGWSLSSNVIFACIDISVIILSLKGVLRFRVLDPNPGLLEYVGTILVLLVLHDAYFYWTHRLMHWPPLFRIAHVTHHRSTHPTPFAAFAFHPIEAGIEYGFVPIIALIVPFHVAPLFVFGFVMTALNVYAHLGVETLPTGFVRHRLGRYLLTATHHDLHHSTVSYNFGFYSNLWDRFMRTNHPHYEAAFTGAAAPRVD